MDTHDQPLKITIRMASTKSSSAGGFQATLEDSAAPKDPIGNKQLYTSGPDLTTSSIPGPLPMPISGIRRFRTAIGLRSRGTSQELLLYMSKLSQTNPSRAGPPKLGMNSSPPGTSHTRTFR